jgi:hypothetical protein
LSALTKILIVLQLVFAVAVSVLLVLLVSRQEAYSKNAEDYRIKYLAAAATANQKDVQHAADLQAIAAATKAQNDALAQLAQERANAVAAKSADQARILTLEGDVAAQKAQLAQQSAALDTANKSILAKDSELQVLRPQVSKLTIENNEIARRNNEQENQLRAAQLAIKALQEQLVARGPSGATSEAGSQVRPMVTASSGAPVGGAVNARVSNVMPSAGRTLVELPLGTRDGIRQNTPVFIYRSTGYVADAIVERVTVDASVAVVTKVKEGLQVQPGDIVSTVGQ